jgi:hypothetical protein
LLILTPQFAGRETGFSARGYEDDRVGAALAELAKSFDDLHLRSPEAGTH